MNPHGSTGFNKRGFQVVDSKDSVLGRSPDPEPRTHPILEVSFFEPFEGGICLANSDVNGQHQTVTRTDLRQLHQFDENGQGIFFFCLRDRMRGQGRRDKVVARMTVALLV